MTKSQYWPVYVLRPGPLSIVRNFGQIGQCTLKLQQLLCSLINAQNGRWTISMAFSLEVDQMKSLGGVC